MRSLPPSCQPGASALTGHTRGTASEKLEEGGGHGRSVCRDMGVPHACYNGWDNASQHRKVKSIAKPSRSWNRGLELTPVNLESLVSACHYRAENTSLLLAHTARRSMRADLG